MSGKVILSFNTLIPDLLTPRNRTIHTLVEVLHIVVAVQRLLGRKRGSPGAPWLKAGVAPPLRTCLQPTAERLGRDKEVLVMAWEGK